MTIIESLRRRLLVAVLLLAWIAWFLAAAPTAFAPAECTHENHSHGGIDHWTYQNHWNKNNTHIHLWSYSNPGGAGTTTIKCYCVDPSQPCPFASNL